MAREFGLGITPWSPLKSGALSGKYTRATAGQVKGDRGPFLEPFLNEKRSPWSTRSRASPARTTAPSREWRWPGSRRSRA
jgi:aryl-alcohol dehydrogenase-like predicted oxidoreductase